MSAYTFSLDKFTIRDTRSHHNDTDTVGFAVKVNKDLHGPIFKHTGDVNNGDHSLDMKIGPITINGTDDIVTIVYEIFNNGHNNLSDSDVWKHMELVMPDPKADNSDDPTSGDLTPGAPMGADQSGSGDNILIELAKAIITFGLTKLPELWKDCDGLVAAKKVTVFADDLHSRTRNAQRTAFQQDTFKAKSLGYDAPCNDSGSDYTVFWSVKRAS